MDSMPPDLEIKRRDSDEKHIATIEVDGTAYQVRKGEWIVSDLKAAIGVDPAKVLAEITHHGLKDLEDDQTIRVRNHEKYMTHARSGGSS